MPTDPQTGKHVPLVGLIAVVVLVAAGAWYFFMYKPANPVGYYPQYLGDSTVNKAIATENPTFAEGIELMRNGQGSAAVEKFRAALPNAKDPAQEGLIKLYTAITLNLIGGKENRAEGIALLKEIAANEHYLRSERATAIEEMAQLYAYTNDGRVTKEVFKDRPYAAMFVSDDIQLSYRRLYEYAISIFPNAVSELRVANWYARKLAASADAESPSLSDEQAAQYKDIVRQAVAAAHENVELMSLNQPQYEATIGQVKLWEAVVASNMRLAGDTSYEDPSKLYLESIDLFKVGNDAADGYARFYYAWYLANASEGSARKVKEVLAPFYNTKAYQDSRVEKFFINLGGSGSYNQRILKQIAGIDSQFKSYLTSIGWTAEETSAN